MLHVFAYGAKTPSEPQLSALLLLRKAKGQSYMDLFIFIIVLPQSPSLKFYYLEPPYHYSSINGYLRILVCFVSLTTFQIAILPRVVKNKKIKPAFDSYLPAFRHLQLATCENTLILFFYIHFLKISSGRFWGSPDELSPNS